MSTETTEGRSIIVADLGKRKGKAIKRIRKDAEGPILDDVNELVARLQQEGQLPAGVAVVVAVVEKKRSKQPYRMGW
jgi:hypothetical protein